MLNRPIRLCLPFPAQPQHALPDIFIWLIANGKRIAYHRLDARDILYSDDPEESGGYCGKVQTIFMKVKEY